MSRSIAYIASDGIIVDIYDGLFSVDLIGHELLLSDSLLAQPHAGRYCAERELLLVE